MGIDFYKKAQIQIVKLRERKPEMRDLLDFCEALLKEQEKANSSFSPTLNGLDISARKDRNSRGLPLLTSENVKIDWELFNILIQRIRNLVVQRVENSISSSMSFVG